MKLAMFFVGRFLVASSLAIGLVAIFSSVMLLRDEHTDDVNNIEVLRHQEIDLGGVSQPEDVTMLLQSMRIQLDRLDTKDAQSSEKQQTTGKNIIVVAPYREDKFIRSDAEVSRSVSGSATLGTGFPLVGVLEKVANTYTLHSLSKHVATGSVVGGVLFVLITFACVYACCVIFSFPNKPRDDSSFISDASMPPFSQRQEQRQPRISSGVSRSPGGVSRDPPERAPAVGVHSSPRTTPLSTARRTPQKLHLLPVCPTLMMPQSESRFGIPMQKVSDVTREGVGDLTVVGLYPVSSPLLHATVKKVGAIQTLAISVAELSYNSQLKGIPHVTLSHTNTASEGAIEGARTLEIKDMRGDLYGSLMMLRSGDCYVLKDGQQILHIDGQAENLHLVFQSATGDRVGDARCSAAEFGGMDHIEIRIEPGVDAILVISIVLAVLLLSFYG
jgi:hypothetical protein